MKRIFFVAGESSGDTHGASLIRALRVAVPSVVCEGLGGQGMAEAGMALRHDLAGDAIMGFAEVVKHLWPMRRLFLDTVAYLRGKPPDAAVLIDYPGFNIRLAKQLHAFGIPVIYYISPQVWAWKRKRIHTLARCVGKMLVILPFEERLYRDVGMESCVYVGHPLLDQIPPLATHHSSLTTHHYPLVIGLLPGSREMEIRRLLEPMLGVAEGIRERYPEARFRTPCVNAQRAAQVRALAGSFPLEVSSGGMYDVLSSARFCMVASGTATLETALFGVPMVIMYKANPLSYWLARRLIKDLQHIGMANILAEREIVPEFIQHQAEAARILPKALELIADGPARRQMQAGLAGVRATLGGEGASARAAQEILAFMEGESHG